MTNVSRTNVFSILFGYVGDTGKENGEKVF